MRRVPPFTLHFPSQGHRTMADSIHIALIDDDLAVLDSLRIYFERQALKTSCFNASEDFLAAVDRSAQFDCVVSDVRMPGVSGLDLVRHLKTRGSRSLSLDSKPPRLCAVSTLAWSTT